MVTGTCAYGSYQKLFMLYWQSACDDHCTSLDS